MANPNMAETIDLEQVRALLQIASEWEISELTVESPSLKVTIRKAGAGRLEVHTGNPPAAMAPPAAAPTAPEVVPARGDLFVPDHMRTISAPMVGTFYRAPTTEAPPFVTEGTVVELGQTVCIIEAMKLFNEIQSEVSGRVARVLAENGAPVEYGQPLFLIEPRPA